MITPAERPLRVPDNRTIERCFSHFIDKNDIILESNSDYPMAIKLFAEAVEYRLNQDLLEGI